MPIIGRNYKLAFLKKLIAILPFIFSITCFGQEVPKDSTFLNSHQRKVCCNELPKYIDSLTELILTDTIKFNKQDVVYTNLGYKNSKSYLPIFFINGQYSYKLDIINPKLVLEFVKEFLDSSKITEVLILDKEAGFAILGMPGRNGAIFIALNNKTKYNLKVAGLEKASKKGGDNFSKRKGDDLLIHD